MFSFALQLPPPPLLSHLPPPSTAKFFGKRGREGTQGRIARMRWERGIGSSDKSWVAKEAHERDSRKGLLEKGVQRCIVLDYTLDGLRSFTRIDYVHLHARTWKQKKKENHYLYNTVSVIVSVCTCLQMQVPKLQQSVYSIKIHPFALLLTDPLARTHSPLQPFTRSATHARARK